ncbi:CsbD family protein [Robbsia sp. Bb-Pol-6]|uniref:CsbD family protein n=1 Tax=Robbsia betulipollinis TaxID=2981849 RepID=A0ABT3ZSD2_9BURK|nr:CsbD family protein [Robbsia betulipollinis]MCY0389461.1 CsbD family protein [Robbsia betulipollinis]
MAEDQIVGTAKNAVGKIQDAAGGLLGDAGLQAEGKGRQLAGKVQAQYGETVDQVVDATKSNPIAALLIAAGVGILLGKLL